MLFSVWFSLFSVSFYKEKTLKLQFGTEVSFLVWTQTKFGIIFGLENIESKFGVGKPNLV